MKFFRSVFPIALCIALISCTTAPSRVDIDAPGYESKQLTGMELLEIARAYGLASNYQFVGVARLIQRSTLDEPDKRRAQQRVDYLMTVVQESRRLATVYRDPVFSDAERRQVFRAVCASFADVSDELRRLSLGLQPSSEQ